MEITIFAGADAIGTARTFALDPPMGVAIGEFEPTDAYDVGRHASSIDGQWVDGRSTILSARLADGTLVQCHAVSIQDSPTLEELEVHLIGISDPPYQVLFGGHPDFRAYYRG